MESEKKRLSVKSAVKAAIDKVKELYSDNNLQDLMLEEVEFSEANNQWLVTVGFSLPEPEKSTSLSTPLITPSLRSRALSRCYKVVNIDADTGKFISMKIRVI